jgi:phospholipid-binding lipoprotein MlaA
VKTLVSLLLSGLLSFVGPHLIAEEVGDPWEGMNRKIYAFNTKADDLVLKPVAKAYTKVLPSPVRSGISNFFSNFGYPMVALNQFLQGKGKKGFADTGRFLVNTTLGIGGLFDPATGMGLVKHNESFSQTFGRWGISSGPYLVIPLWGASSIRGGAGALGDVFAHPMRYVVTSDPLMYGLTGTNLLNTRAELLNLEQFLLGDKYIFLRDAYLQREDFLIQDGEVDDPFLDDDF